MTLSPLAREFIRHWGRMGPQWGINRTVAQVHALLFVARAPLDAEEIGRLLDVSRSNVSTSLRELIGWGVVRRMHAIGDRRDRFEALGDVVETFRAIASERKRREVEPTIAALERCLAEAEAEAEGSPDPSTCDRLRQILEFTRTVSDWYAQIERLSPTALMRLLRAGPMLARLIGGTTPEPPAGERAG